MATKSSQTAKSTTLTLFGFPVFAGQLQDASFVNDPWRLPQHSTRSGQQQHCQPQGTDNSRTARQASVKRNGAHTTRKTNSPCWFVLPRHALSYFSCVFWLALSICLPVVAFVAITSSDPISETTPVVPAALRKRDGLEMDNTALAICSPRVNDPAGETMQVDVDFDNLDNTQVSEPDGKRWKRDDVAKDMLLSCAEEAARPRKWRP